MARLGVIKTSAALADGDQAQEAVTGTWVRVWMEEGGPVTTQTWRQNMTQNMGKYGTNIIMLLDIPPKYSLNLFLH